MKLRTLLQPLLGLGLLLAGCADENDYQNGNYYPPGGNGGYDPGGPPGDSSGSTGSGNAMTPPDPLDCDESLRSCEHEFTFAGSGSESSVSLRGSFAPDGWAVGVPMTKNGAVWSATVKVPWDGEIQYKFVVDGQWITDPANPDGVSDGVGGTNSLLTGVTCKKWTCDAPVQYGTFDWRDAVLYFVFVDRFVDGNPGNNGSPISGVEQPASYRGGDWAGVTQKISEGYFNDLGVNTLWLTVPMENTNQSGAGTDGHLYSAYHGYWMTDPAKTEEHFGSLDDLKTLVGAAHEKGLKVVLDYAMNHVHESSPVYAAHRDWFWPLNDGSVSNCTCGGGCSWDGDQGKRCWFTSYLPDFNFTNPEARNFSVDNAMQWIRDTGIDGFRLDAVKHIDDAWLTQLRSRVRAEIEPTSGEHFYMVGETFTGDQNTIKYYVNPSMLDGQFDFPLRAKLLRSLLMRAQDADSNVAALDGFLIANEGFYGAGVMSTFVGNHDIPRPIHFAQDTPLWDSEWHDGKDRAWGSATPQLPSGSSAFERLANAFTVLFTTKGVPLIYYGDEYAMPGGGDPDNRRMMQWSGYSAGQTLMNGHIKKLTAIRAEHAALRRGSRTSLSRNADTMSYRMSGDGDTVYVALNRADGQQTVGGLPSGQLKDLLTGATVSGPSVAVPARSSMILVSQ